MFAGGRSQSFGASSRFFPSRNVSMERGSIVMQATDTIDVEPMASGAATKKQYDPEMFGNKYVKKSDVSKNPIFNLA